MLKRYGELKTGDYFCYESSNVFKRTLVLGTGDKTKKFYKCFDDKVVTCIYVYDKSTNRADIYIDKSAPVDVLDKRLSYEKTFSSIDAGFDKLFGLSSLALNYIGFVHSLQQQVLYRFILGKLALVNDMRGNTFLARLGLDCSEPVEEVSMFGLWSVVCEKYQDYGLVALDNI